MIDLRSDTVTRPDAAMREAARDAPVGDDVYGEDPSVNELERRAAERLGMADALFVPSGTMGNQIAARVHAGRGDEVIAERESHIVNWEVGGLAQHSALQVRLIDAGEAAVPDPSAIEAAIVAESVHQAGTGLICLENTHNGKGGVVAEPDRLAGAAAVAREYDVPVHLDGARLFNAAVALEVPASELVEPVDSVMFCLSKGLGAPVGSILAGSEGFVERAHRIRKLLGGGMRQAGIIAAPGLEALENVERLAIDHENATRLAAGLAEHPDLRVSDPDTNIVLVDLSAHQLDVDGFLEACRSEDVLGTHMGPQTARFCTHLDVDRADVEAAIERIHAAI